MQEAPNDLARWCAIGIGATVFMDLWSALLRRLGVPTLNYALLGRWCGHWRHGVWFHRPIQAASPVPGEGATGWGLHYLTGVVFAVVFGRIIGAQWTTTPTLAPALAFGLVTVLMPWLLMQPALGAGVAAARTPQPWRSRAISVATHGVFGLGMYVAALALARV